MIKFQEKLNSSLKSDILKGASIGATLGGSLHKLGKVIFREVTEKTPRSKIVFMDEAGHIINSDKANKLRKAGKSVIEGVQQLVDKEGKALYDNKVIKTSGEVFRESVGKTAERGSQFFSNFGKLSDFLKGANNKFWDRITTVGNWILKNPISASAVTAAIGACLVIGYYMIKSTYNESAKKLTNMKKHMIDEVVNSLIAMGYKRDVDFTTSPSIADYMKTKVCIIVSSTKDELCLTINSINDPKLEPIARTIIKNLPSGSRFYQRDSGSNNELTLAVTHSNNGDHTYIAAIVEKFIRKKYPVFLVEIN